MLYISLSSFFIRSCLINFFFFFFNDTATTEIYTLSLHDALPILFRLGKEAGISAKDVKGIARYVAKHLDSWRLYQDRKSTRLNSSHLVISYAVFCLKKKKKKINEILLNH